jgi:S1-C subfamily serine protease
MPVPRHRSSPTRSLPTAVVVVLLIALLSLAPGCSLTRDSRPLAPDATATDPADPVGRVLRSVVEVRATLDEPGFVDRVGVGTGVIFDTDGTSVTNDHVLRAGESDVADDIEVILPDGRSAVATVVASYPTRDLAFLDIDADGLVPAAFVADIGELREGDAVFAVGAPRRFTDAVVEGTILSVQEPALVNGLPGITTLIVTDAVIRRGFSGGPLATSAKGRVVGINVGLTERSGDDLVRALTIPASLVLAAAAETGLR